MGLIQFRYRWTTVFTERYKSSSIFYHRAEAIKQYCCSSGYVLPLLLYSISPALVVTLHLCLLRSTNRAPCGATLTCESWRYTAEQVLILCDVTTIVQVKDHIFTLSMHTSQLNPSLVFYYYH